MQSEEIWDKISLSLKKKEKKKETLALQPHIAASSHFRRNVINQNLLISFLPEMEPDKWSQVKNEEKMDNRLEVLLLFCFQLHRGHPPSCIAQLVILKHSFRLLQLVFEPTDTEHLLHPVSRPLPAQLVCSGRFWSSLKSASFCFTRIWLSADNADVTHIALSVW